MKISWTDSKKHLATLWFVGAGILFLVILLQSIFGSYENKISDAWQWFLPTILPTLSLMVSIFVLEILGKAAKIRKIDVFMYRLTFSLSLFYLVTVALTIFLAPFAAENAGTAPTELMKQSNLWLGPFQGLVSASLGAFFIGGKQE
jgi:hypothetical protein